MLVRCGESLLAKVKKMMMTERSRVLVVWHDAHSHTEWCDITDIGDEPYVVNTVGWLLPDAKPNHVVVAQSVSDDDSLDSVLSIPVGMVQSLTIL